jgi:glutathione synthase/RimK-type ligase-like ATP-grasp enzyme
MKILITDPFLRKTFDVVNILKQNKLDVIICFNGNLFQKILVKLLYFSVIKKLEIDNFNEDLKLIENSIKDELVFFPLEEDKILKFYDYLETGNSKIKSLLPSKHIFNLVREKKDFSKFCILNNISVPKEYTFQEIENLEQLPSKIILKPSIGSGSIGIKFADTKDDFNNINIADESNYLIQERIENGKDILGGFFLFDKGNFISYYGHKRIRTYPEEGGVTVYSKVDYNEEIKELGIELLKKLNWSGIAMVEFLYDKNDNSYKIIELNPRAWGSIMLSEFSNSKIIKNYVNISLNNKIEDSKLNDDVFIRWFFPWDFISYLKKSGKIKDFWKLNLRNTCYINFTYGNLFNSILFLILNILDLNKVKKLFRKALNK